MIWRITAFVYETQAASDADSWDQHNTFFFSKQKPSYMYSTLYYRKKKFLGIADLLLHVYIWHQFLSKHLKLSLTK